ncbi:protein of unknown function [Legionella hackeliae]|uniref:Uncharacterized protein n=1 Tax=Legionella hackeliae TaxID=449 RepID=A0A0A8UNV4_LEGHA|nr:protein of unknown function [Legionella hackeliae]
MVDWVELRAFNKLGQGDGLVDSEVAKISKPTESVTFLQLNRDC